MSESISRQQPYHGLAAIYDYVMRHVDYAEWVDYIDRLFTRFGNPPNRVIDLACGTGNATLELSQRGYTMTGADSSEAMLRMAREKALRQEREIPFCQFDLRQLDNLGPFGAAVCLYDSLNYLLTPADLDQAFQAIYHILKPGGLFIFDVCTQRNSLHYFSDESDEEKGPGFVYQRRSHYDQQQGLQFNHFEIRFTEPEEYFEETHTQRIYPLAKLEARIAVSPFELLDAFDGFTFKKASEDADRVHYVLRRPIF